MRFFLYLITLLWVSACQSSSKSYDLYKNFAELQRVEKPTAYKIESQYRGPDILILAPHGGLIEFGTSEIARSLAGKKWNFYSFNGLLKSGNSRLHITSRHFDEPTAVKMSQKSQVCVSIHGYKNKPGDPNICFGGRNDQLGQKLHSRLRGIGLQNTDDYNGCGRFYGQDENNIINRCELEGVQLELSRDFREKLLKNKKLHKTFSQTVQAALREYLIEVQQ